MSMHYSDPTLPVSPVAVQATTSWHTLHITPAAALQLGVVPASGHGTILCTASELASLPVDARRRAVVALYDDSPQQVYACRAAAYEYSSHIGLTFFPRTAVRLRLLHHDALLAESPAHALELAAAYKPASSPPSRVIPENCEREGRAMTVLFVTHDFRVGGLEQVVIDLAVLARTLGHKPVICYAGIIDPDTRQEVEAAGIEHVRLPEGYEARKAFLRTRNVSIVNAHYATIMAQESHELGIPYLQTIHNMYLWLDKAAIAQWQALDALTAGYIVVSANAAMVADLRLGLPPEKMVIVPNGVTVASLPPDAVPEQDDALRAELGIPRDGIVFVQVASLNGVKGHLVTVEAAALALQKRQDLYFVLLGKKTDSAIVTAIYEKIHRYKLENHVILTGYRKDVPRFLNLARAMIAPSFVEGWSLAISEAVQMGIPVIATDVGGACEQLQGKENILLPAMLEDMPNLTAQEFFFALRDEDLHRKKSLHLANAFLSSAQKIIRVQSQRNISALSTADAYGIHIDIMRILIEEKGLQSAIP